MSKRTYDGMAAGIELVDGDWTFEGKPLPSPATESGVLETLDESLQEPDETTVAAARKLVFGSGATYTAQALLAIAAAYDAEVGPDGDGSDQIMSILRETARRIACVEALTI